MDKMFEGVVAQKTAKMAELKDAADYDEMDDANRAMFDKLLLAQWTVQKENMGKMGDKLDRDGMTKEQWEAMTPEEQEAAKAKMSEMKDMLYQKADDRNKSDMEMRNKAGYYKMTREQQAFFDEKLKERSNRQNEKVQGMVEKF